MSDKPTKKDDLSGVDPRIIEAAGMAVPMALDWAGKKLSEAFDHFKSRFEDETGGDFDAVEPEPEAMTRNQAFIDRVPQDKGFSDDLRARLVHGGAQVDTIMADKSANWPGKGWDAVRVQDARQTLGMMTLDMSKADITNANLRGADVSGINAGGADTRGINAGGADTNGFDLSQALGAGHHTGVRVASAEAQTPRKPAATHRGPDLPGHGRKP